ncbi:uncharacterized protein [Maniola hyperantus]|uniref:uncharacterized protein n=1 Tax=Aphantopus hyperantus TaxID=2795564 RepID=UPI003749ECAF
MIDGKFDVSLLMDMVNESVAGKMKSLESRLVQEIKAAVSSTSRQETDRLQAELQKANERCARYEAEIQSLKEKLKNQSNSRKTETQAGQKVREERQQAGTVQVAAPAPVCAAREPSGTPSADAVRAQPTTSYAAVARKTESKPRAHGQNDYQSQPEEKDSDDWSEVRSKKMHPIKKGGNISIIPIKAVERKKYLHIWRLHKETTEDNLKEYIQAVLGTDSYNKVDKIVQKIERSYSSFRVCVSESDFERLSDPDIWPKDAEYSEWTWFRGPARKPQT